MMESNRNCPPPSKSLVGSVISTLQDTVSHLTVHSWKRSQSIDSGFVFDLDGIHEAIPQSSPQDSNSSLCEHASAYSELVACQEDAADDLNDDVKVVSSSKMFSLTESFGLTRKSNAYKLSSRVTSLDSLDSSLSLGEHSAEGHVIASGDHFGRINEMSKNLGSACGKKCERSGADCDNEVQDTSFKQPVTKQSWLLRLFESKLFNMSIAIQYLFNSKEPGVQAYIGKCLGNCCHLYHVQDGSFHNCCCCKLIKSQVNLTFIICVWKSISSYTSNFVGWKHL